jgi:hypothetical protein
VYARGSIQYAWQENPPWPADDPLADLFSELDNLAVSMPPGAERDAACCKLWAGKTVEDMMRYLSFKVYCPNFGFLVYKKVLASIPGDELEAVVRVVGERRLWFQKGNDSNYFSCQGED